MTSLCKLLCLLADLNIPVAPRKTFPASTTLEFLGIRLDSDNMTASLPEDKYERLKVDLSSWLTKKFCTLKELQSLIGTLQFACRVVVPGRPFLHLFEKISQCGKLFLTTGMVRTFFLESKTIQSPDLHFSICIWQPGVWRFLQQPMVPKTVAARVPFSYGATKHCLERTLPDLSCLHGLGPPMVRRANTPLVR